MNEYEYEEEYDDRYGPAEREREFSINGQVPSFIQFYMETYRKLALQSSAIIMLTLLVRIYQRKDRKESQGIWER